MSTNEIGVGIEENEEYGHAIGYDHSEGEFIRDTRGQIDTYDETNMVADELARTLETPIGDDPWRPNLGLDREKFTENMVLAREAIIEAIGPEADPRVSHIESIDIQQPDGQRQNSRVTILLTLTNGSPVEFRASFEALVGFPGQQRGGTSPSQTELAGELLASSDYRDGEVDVDRTDDVVDEDEGPPDVGDGDDEPKGERAPWTNMIGEQLGGLELPPTDDE